MRKSILAAVFVLCAAGLQGCVLAAAGAGAAGGYAAHEEGYRVQSPVKKDEAGGYKGQNPVTHDESKDQTPEARPSDE
jgi:osmotically-inducible protein OsmY